MTDQTVVEGNPITPPEQGSATTPASTPGTGQPSQDLAAQVRELQAVVRSLQSGKDKGNDRLRKELKPLVEIAKHLGVEPEKVKEAQRNILLDRLYEQEFGEPNQPEQPVGNGPTGNVEEVKAMLKKSGLEETDPDVLAVVTSGKTGIELAMDIGALKQRKAGAPSPTPAQSPAPVTPAAQPKNREHLKAEYINEIQGNRGNRAAIEQIQATYKERGLDIENIGFGL